MDVDLALALLRGAVLATPALLVGGAWGGLRPAIGSWLGLTAALAVAAFLERRSERSERARVEAGWVWFVAFAFGAGLATLQAFFARDGLALLGVASWVAVTVAVLIGALPGAVMIGVVGARFDPACRPGATAVRTALTWGKRVGAAMLFLAFVAALVSAGQRDGGAAVLGLIIAPPLYFALTFTVVFTLWSALYWTCRALDRLESHLSPGEAT